MKNDQSAVADSWQHSIAHNLALNPSANRPAFRVKFLVSHRSGRAGLAFRWGQSIEMILWTIQTERAWSALRNSGILRTSRKNIIEESWLLPYQWMTEQMKTRVGPPPEARYLPLWTWYQWEGEKRRRPDLRASGHLGKGEKGIRIEFECCEGAALLSDFDLWHYVLNYWYLPESENEGDVFEAELGAQGFSFFKQKPVPKAEYHRKIVESWNRIFDLYWSEPDLAEPFSRKSIQATVWELSIDQVRSYKHFTSR